MKLKQCFMRNETIYLTTSTPQCLGSIHIWSSFLRKLSRIRKFHASIMLTDANRLLRPRQSFLQGQLSHGRCIYCDISIFARMPAAYKERLGTTYSMCNSGCGTQTHLIPARLPDSIPSTLSSNTKHSSGKTSFSLSFKLELIVCKANR